jgi:hypothetical protein
VTGFTASGRWNYFGKFNIRCPNSGPAVVKILRGIMKSESESFIRSLFAQCKNREQWLSVAQFGMEALVKEKHLLTAMLIEQAFNECEKITPEDVAFRLSHLLNELNLTFASEDQ